MVELRGKPLQFLTFFGGSFSIMQCGFNLGWPTYALPYLLSNSSAIPVTNDEGSWIASIHLLGGICGSILAAFTLDVLGRKTMLLAVLVFASGIWLILAFARSTLELLIARFLAGICDGVAFPGAPLYLAEVSNPKIRGLLVNGTQVVYFFGIFLPNLLGVFLNIYTIAIISSVFALVGSFIYLFVPESPYFYLIKTNVDEAKSSLRKFTGGSSNEVENYLVLMQNTLNESSGGKWWNLFTDQINRKFVFLLIASRLFQMFSGYMGIVFYAQILFRETEIVNPAEFVSIFYLLQVAGMIVNSSMVDRVGRRPLIITSISSVTVALSILSVYFTLENVTEINVSDYSWCPIVGLFMYIVCFSLGLQGIIFLLCNEVFPMHVKTYAVMGLGILYNLFGSVVSKFFQYTKDEFGLHVPFIIFTLSSMCGIPFFIYFIPETKRKTLEEIQDQLRSKKKSNTT
ncbi:hypothetical protein FQR65_LT14693 [Abscondita terminalis]|nr:hypothetical protein FQR65_LT14693 [Abscondita terminalis]